MYDRDLILQIRSRPALFGLDGSYSQSVTFLLGLDLGQAGGLLRGFTEWLVVVSGRDTSLRWNALVLEVEFPGQGVPERDLDPADSRRASDRLLALLAEFLDIRDSPVALAEMYAAYANISRPGN